MLRLTLCTVRCRVRRYPPSGEVTFRDITMQWDGKTEPPKFTTAIVDDDCHARAHVVDERTIKITWNTQ